MARNAAFISLSLVPHLRPAHWLGRIFVWSGQFLREAVMNPADEVIRDILRDTRVIALVGWSPNPDRPSHGVAAYLVRRGYRVIAVNPGQAGKVAPWGEVVRAKLSEIEEEVDMVDIFRRSDAVLPVVEEALAHFPRMPVIWMQLGVMNELAAEMARKAGAQVVMNRCPAIEIPRLFG